MIIRVLNNDQYFFLGLGKKDGLLGNSLSRLFHVKINKLSS